MTAATPSPMRRGTVQEPRRRLHTATITVRWTTIWIKAPSVQKFDEVGFLKYLMSSIHAQGSMCKYYSHTSLFCRFFIIIYYLDNHFWPLVMVRKSLSLLPWSSLLTILWSIFVKIVGLLLQSMEIRTVSLNFSANVLAAQSILKAWTGPVSRRIQSGEKDDDEKDIYFISKFCSTSSSSTVIFCKSDQYSQNIIGAFIVLS